MENIITSIEVQKKNKERVNIYVDGDFFIACDMTLVYNKGIEKGKTIDKDLLLEITEEDNYIKAKNKGLNYISRSIKTENEIIKKLSKAGFDEKTINRVLSFLKEYNFVNDEEYVELFIKEKIRKYGAKKIKYDLRAKGIEEKLILKKISNIDEEQTFEVAFNIALKKYELFKVKYDDKQVIRKKIYDLLLRKGYDYDIINKIVSKLEEGDYE